MAKATKVMAKAMNKVMAKASKVMAKAMSIAMAQSTDLTMAKATVKSYG